RGFPPAGAQIHRTGCRGARIFRAADPRWAGGAPDGERLRRLVAARPRRSAGFGERGRAGFLLLLRLGRGNGRLSLRPAPTRRRPPPRSKSAGLPGPAPRGGRLRPLPSAAPKNSNPLSEASGQMLRDVFIVGVGQTPVGEHWDLGLRELGRSAVEDALADARIEAVDALYAGNMLGGAINGQENVATLLADAAGLLPAEAWKVEAACASGAAAVRAAAMAVASGAQEIAVAVRGGENTGSAPAAAAPAPAAP